MPFQIPIVSISNAAIFVLIGLITLRLLIIYRKSKGGLLRQFLVFFIFLTIYFFLLASPFLIFKTAYSITAVLFISYFFLYLAMAFLIIIPLRILKWPKVERIYLTAILLSLIFTFFMYLAHFEKVQIVSKGVILYWTYVGGSPRIFWVLRTVGLTTGIFSAITALSSALFFFRGGYLSKEKLIRKRAFLMGGGLILLALAGGITYIGGGIQAYNLLILITTSLLAIFGLLMLYLGIIVTRPKEELKSSGEF